MKTLLATAALVTALSLPAVSASAASYAQNGTIFSSTCRAGTFFWEFPIAMAEPLGSACVFSVYGNTFFGTVTMF